MKILFIILSSLFIFLSCDTEEQIYHYNKYDDEYAGLILMAAQECIEENDIFAALDTTNDFDTAEFKVNDVYKITRVADSITNTFFMKITAITTGTPDTMTVILNGDGGDNAGIAGEYDKVINFDSDLNSDIYDTIGLAACNITYKDIWSASGLGSSEQMSLVWDKETIEIPDDAGSGDDDDDDDPEAYKEQTDSFRINRDYPLFFSYFNAAYSSTTLAEASDTTVNKTGEMTISPVVETDDECVDNANCKFANTTNFADCNIVVDTNIVTKSAYEDQFFSYSANSGDCKLIPGVGQI